MPRVISSKTFESLERVSTVCLVGSEILRDEDLEGDVERVRKHWPDVTARDLSVAAFAIAFCLASLDGAVPQLGNGSYCSSLFMTEYRSLKDMGMAE